MATTTPHTSTQRILVGSVTPDARGVVLDQDGELATGQTVTATIKDLDGTVSGTPDRATTENTELGYYTVALTTAEAAQLDLLQVEWTYGGAVRTTTYHRVVGGFMITRASLQERQGLTDLSDVELDLARDWITDLIEWHTGAAWSPRYDVDTYYAGPSDGYDLRRSLRYRDRHVLPFAPVRAIRSVTIDGTATTDYDIDLDTGVIRGTRFYGDVSIGFEHGHSAPPETLRRAAVVGAADMLLRSKSGLSERTRSVINELGSVQTFSFPGTDHPTGIDFVDAAIMDHRQYRLPGIA